MGSKSRRRKAIPSAAKKVIVEPPAPAREEKKARQRYLRLAVKYVPLLVLALSMSFISSRTGLISEWQTTSLNLQMRLDVPSEESSVVIVDITHRDFDEIFQGQTRPLNPATLHRVVSAIAKGDPCVIGVDVDTSFPEFRNFSVTEDMENVIWSRETAEMPADVMQAVVPLDVLGGQAEYNDKSGIPFLIDDSKRIPRYYTHLIKTADGEAPAFGWAVLKEAMERNCDGIIFPEIVETSERFIIGYSRGAKGEGRMRIPSSNVLKFAEDPEWQNNNLIKNKIVLLGGTYLGEDQSDTPIGAMSGVEIIANVIESDLRGGVKPPGFISMSLLQVFDGILLVALFQIFSWRKAFLMSLPFIMILAFACSFFTYYSFSYWLFFAPIMVGVVFTELFVKVNDFFKKRYQREIKATYASLGGHVKGEPAPVVDE